jgi:hypothetical protein
MNIISTDFKVNVNGSSSFTVYISKDRQIAMDIYKIALINCKMLTDADWYYNVSTMKVLQDCRVPKFFHNGDYFITVIEHNRGDWDKEPVYELYIVE